MLAEKRRTRIISAWSKKILPFMGRLFDIKKSFVFLNEALFLLIIICILCC